MADVMLVCPAGTFGKFGHGEQGFLPFFHPQSGLILMRVSLAAAIVEYCLRAGCYVAPPELQDADR